MKRQRFIVFVVALAVPSQAAATEHEVADYGGVLDACYAAAETDETMRACIGKMSSACMDSQDGGHTTLGMSSCTNAEVQVWDKYLNRVYQTTVAEFTAMDTDEATYFPEFAKRVENLREAQRAWITFRDAECGLAYAMWGSGSMRSIAWARCQLEMTADRTIELKNLGSEMR